LSSSAVRDTLVEVSVRLNDRTARCCLRHGYMLFSDKKIRPEFELDDILNSSSPPTLAREHLTILQNALLELERDMPLFPQSCCEIAATRLEKLNIGLVYKNGMFTYGSQYFPHAWNLDPSSGLYIDITAKQFDSSLPAILIVSTDSHWAREHYLEDVYAAW